MKREEGTRNLDGYGIRKCHLLYKKQCSELETFPTNPVYL
jgi:hypothetical protein